MPKSDKHLLKTNKLACGKTNSVKEFNLPPPIPYSPHTILENKTHEVCTLCIRMGLGAYRFGNVYLINE